MSELPLLRVSNVSRTFTKGNSSVTPLSNVTFSIPEGSFTVIYGPSGSGKSTLLHILMGIDTPTNGTVTYESRDLFQMSKDERAFFRAHTMGIVQQTDHWVKSLSVLDNVALPLVFLGVDREHAYNAARESLKRVGMQDHAGKSPSSLSGGEQQRAAMARALVNNPSYIVADEPTGNLDSKNGDALMKLLRYMNKEFNRTVVLVTHNLEYLTLADQVLLIEDGKLTEMKNSNVDQVVTRLMAETKLRLKQWKE